MRLKFLTGYLDSIFTHSHDCVQGLISLSGFKPHHLHMDTWAVPWPIQWRIQDFPEEGAPTPRGAQTYDFAIFSQKLHEIERIWAPKGGARPSRPLRSATAIPVQDITRLYSHRSVGPLMRSCRRCTQTPLVGFTRWTTSTTTEDRMPTTRWRSRSTRRIVLNVK